MDTRDRHTQTTAGEDMHLQAMATVAMLLESVDMARLLATRDRISVNSTQGALGNIRPQLAYQEYVR